LLRAFGITQGHLSSHGVLCAVCYNKWLQSQRRSSFMITTPNSNAEEGGLFQPLSRSSLSQQAYQEIKGYLMRGRLKPGQRLVSRALATDLGISTTPVREALFRLASEQALVLDHRNTVLVPDLRQSEYREIRDIRIELEGLAAERAAIEASAADIDTLSELQERHIAAQDTADIEDALAINEEFHFALCRMSQLPTLVKMVEMLWLKCGPTLNLFYTGRVWGRLEHPHFQLLRCMRAKDGRGAREAMRVDIMEGARAILSNLKDQ
jgi:DNA-binding GntR family transcriptional regulator